MGPQTIENCAEAGIIAIGIEAGKTLLLEKEKVTQLCTQHKICIHAL
ncbi:MAG: UDP-2,3-diacylglucosamine diphosphatase LpxI domain-containing protein [Akkermansiaceae bacterium]